MICVCIHMYIYILVTIIHLMDTHTIISKRQRHGRCKRKVCALWHHHYHHHQNQHQQLCLPPHSSPPMPLSVDDGPETDDKFVLRILSISGLRQHIRVHTFALTLSHSLSRSFCVCVFGSCPRGIPSARTRWRPLRAMSRHVAATAAIRGATRDVCTIKWHKRDGANTRNVHVIKPRSYANRRVYCGDIRWQRRRWWYPIWKSTPLHECNSNGVRNYCSCMRARTWLRSYRLNNFNVGSYAYDQVVLNVFRIFVVFCLRFQSNILFHVEN